MPEDAPESPRPADGTAKPQRAVPADARIVGIDVARGLALLGMFIAHAAPALPAGSNSLLEFFLLLPDERARLLFAVTAGLGLGLLTGGIRPPARGALDARGSSRRGVLRRQVSIRAIYLIVLGFLLTATGVLVYVILDEYGVAFLILLPALFLGAWVQIGLGAVLLVVLPGLLAALAVQPAVLMAASPPAGAGFGQHLLALVTDWFVTGAYPVGIWVAVMLLGMGLVRLGLHRPVVVLGAFGIGAAVMVGSIGSAMGFGATGIRAPLPSGDPLTLAVGTSFFTVGNVGFAIALTMGIIALTSLAAPAVARVTTWLTSPIAAAGSMPLSVYSAHVLVLVWTTAPGPNGVPTDDSWATVIGLIVGTLVVSWLWRRFIGRGPLEWLAGVLSGRIRLGADRADSDPDQGGSRGEDAGPAPIR
ncbi:DUF418 domain-containing protein [Agromyces seonyuensis]|nr:DUF418 domain-containing protein [Agromyces seonyuensis]